MAVVFKANGIDFHTAADAIAAVEKKGSGSVVKFHVAKNLPGLHPDLVYRSCALWSFQKRADGNMKWMAHDIFSGHGYPYKEERPS